MSAKKAGETALAQGTVIALCPSRGPLSLTHMRLFLRNPAKEEKRGVFSGRSSPLFAHLQVLDPYLKDSRTITRMTGGHYGQVLIPAQAKSLCC